VSDNVRFHHFYIGGHPSEVEEASEEGRRIEVGRRVTAAYVLDEKRDQKDREIWFAYAFCSPQDHFTRKEGRWRAQKALMASGSDRGRHTKLTLREGEGFFYQVSQLLQEKALEDLPNSWKRWWERQTKEEARS
jgi:hypothetical protein